MTGEQVLIVALASTVGVLSLLGSLIAWRMLGRSGRSMRSAADRLSAQRYTLPGRLVLARTELEMVDAAAERALWTLSNFDERADRAMVDLRSKRVASDTLRLRMIEGRLTIARLRQLVRLMIRLSEMRRAFL